MYSKHPESIPLTLAHCSFGRQSEFRYTRFPPALNCCSSFSAWAGKNGQRPKSSSCLFITCQCLFQLTPRSASSGRPPTSRLCCQVNSSVTNSPRWEPVSCLGCLYLNRGTLQFNNPLLSAPGILVQHGGKTKRWQEAAPQLQPNKETDSVQNLMLNSYIVQTDFLNHHKGWKSLSDQCLWLCNPSPWFIKMYTLLPRPEIFKSSLSEKIFLSLPFHKFFPLIPQKSAVYM